MSVVVIGDLIVDETVELRELGMSAEGMMAHAEVARRKTLGGAANVARHLSRLGSSVTLVHAATMQILGLTSAESLRVSQVAYGDGPITKTRFYCGSQKVLKVNSTNRYDAIPLSVIDSVLSRTSGPVAVVDMGHGTIDDPQGIVWTCKRHGRKLYVDGQLSQTVPNYDLWRGADELFLNDAEFARAGQSALSQVGAYHRKRGDAGSEYHNPQGRGGWWDAPKVNVVDTVGAGDAYLAAWIVSGSLEFANAWAALSCTKVGTELPEIEELRTIDEALTRFCRS